MGARVPQKRIPAMVDVLSSAKSGRRETRVWQSPESLCSRTIQEVCIMYEHGTDRASHVEQGFLPQDRNAGVTSQWRGLDQLPATAPERHRTGEVVWYGTSQSREHSDGVKNEGPWQRSWPHPS